MWINSAKSLFHVNENVKNTNTESEEIIMKCKSETMRLYAVTDRAWTGKQTLMEQVEAAIRGGATCIQLREKDLDEEHFLAEALEMRKLCTRYGVPFIINDNVEIALAVDADGVHIGQDDMTVPMARKLLGENKIIGTSAHNVIEAVKAKADGADYIGCGAVFGSRTKTDAGFLGVEGLKEICRQTDLPVVAIGGISRENVPFLADTGVDGIAVVSAILAETDIAAATAGMLKLVRKIK